MTLFVPRPYFVLAILAMAATVTFAHADDTATASVQPAPYNFAWKVSGATAAAPTQVFDSGSRILLQFKDSEHIPAILADVPGGQILLEWHPEPPYIVINHLESHLVFHLGNAIAFARRADGSGAPQGVETSSVAPILVTGSALPPVAHEQLVADRRTEDAQVNDRSVLRDGSTPTSTENISDTHGKTDPTGFDLRVQDKTIDLALNRWAQESGWKVDWVSTLKPPITASSRVPGDFLTAVATVMLALEQADYPLAAIPDATHKTYVIHDTSVALHASSK